jgi:predicted site-specific integrase-resolvase
MSLEIEGQIFYNTSEACKLAGTSRFTFLRWVKERKITDVGLRNQNGWRLFTEEDIDRLRSKKRVVKVDCPVGRDRP